MYRQPSTTLQNSTLKCAQQNPKSISQKAIYHIILTRTPRYQVFEMLLWEPSEDAAFSIELRSVSKVIFETNVTPSKKSSSDSFSTVLPIVNGGYLETIIILVLLSFNFFPHRSHHSLTHPRLWIGYSAAVTLTPGDGTTAIKVESSA